MSLDLSNTQFAKWSQALMNALVNLHGMNAEAVLDSNLPRIVVFGDQSAGKSSLVEGVTGIRVPRDAGTCTRCPMELSMFSTGSDWSCDITLNFKYDDDGRPVKLADVRRIPFGQTLFDKSAVEMALRRAQAAILNTSKPSEDFLSMNEEDLRSYRRIDTSKSGTLKFSRNTISVTIHDPLGANLSFLDLPGLISNESKDVIDLVQDLAVGEIKKENSLILVTIPMTGDMELQTAVRLAGEVDPEGLRTIGVLTKPDAVPKGASSARRAWMDVLSGRDRKLTHGYYCVRLPDDDERLQYLTKEEYHMKAQNFFERESPWNTLLDKRRLGIQGLVEDLSRHLTVLIDKALPKIREEVQKNLDKCQEELNGLPPAPTNEASTEILKMVNGFCQEIGTIIFGSGNDKMIVQQNRESYDRFKKEILATAPNFQPFESRLARAANTADDRAESTNDSDGEHNHSASVYLRDVRRIVKSSLTWELPHNVPFDAKRILIKQFTNCWTSPAITCYNEICERLDEFLHNCINKHFKYFPQLRSHIILLVEDRLQQTKSSALATLRDTLQMECDLYFTQNSHYFSTKRDSWLSRYKKKRQDKSKIESVYPTYSTPSLPPPPATSYVDNSRKMRYVSPPQVEVVSATQRALSALAELGFEGLTSEDLNRLYEPDPYEEELIVMADVRAYFHVAYKRIIDHVPLTIEIFLNRATGEELQDWLIQKLDVGGNDARQRLANLISQDPDIVATRSRLMAEISKLKDIQKELRDLGALNNYADGAFKKVNKVSQAVIIPRPAVILEQDIEVEVMPESLSPKSSWRL